MLKTTFIIPFHQAWDRPADFQRQTCLRLAKNHRVIALMDYLGVFWLTAVKQWFLNQTPNLPQSVANLTFSRPIYLLPGKRWPKIHQLNQQLWLWWLSLKFGLWGKLSQTWLWIFEPDFWFYPGTIPTWKSLYDCVDDHTQADSVLTQQLKLQEINLIKSVDLFTTNSQTLAKLHQKIRQPDQIVVQGFDLALWPKSLPPQRKSLNHLALFGALDARVDWALLKYLVTKFSDLTFDLAGPIQPAISQSAVEIIKQSNVVYHGVLPRPKLKQLLLQADLCLIPYLPALASVKNCFPMKVLEYFAFGKPVVASQILELAYYRQDLTLADSKASWVKAIQKYRQFPLNRTQRLNQRQVAWQHRYEQKLAQILTLMKVESS